MKADSFLDLTRGGCIGSSNFANNTTLEVLELMLFYEDVVYTMYEGMEQLANALRRNQGLQKLLISWGLITDAGHRFVLESLRDNTTLLKLSTIEECPDQYYLGPSRNYVETMKIQSPIDGHMKLNRFWDR